MRRPSLQWCETTKTLVLGKEDSKYTVAQGSPKGEGAFSSVISKEWGNQVDEGSACIESDNQIKRLKSTGPCDDSQDWTIFMGDCEGRSQSNSLSEEKERIEQLNRHFNTWASSFQNGQFTSINHHVAKLMFYLRCVTKATGNFDLKLLRSVEPSSTSRLGDFTQSNSLNEEELDAMLLMCYRLSPKLLNKKCMFLEPAGSVSDKGHEVWELSQINKPKFAHLQAPDPWTFQMGDKTIAVKKFITFSSEWLQFFYLDPMMQLRSHLSKVFCRLTENGTGVVSYAFAYFRFQKTIKNMVDKARSIK